MATMNREELAKLEAIAALRAGGEVEAALAKINEWLEASPHLAVVHNYQGTLYHALGLYTDAVASYQAAIQQQANYLDAYYNLGLASLKLHDREAAKRVFEAILSLSPEHAGARFQLGRLSMEASDYEAALVIFKSLVEDHPHHAESNANLAACYLRLGCLNEAIAAYEAALALAPKDTQALFNLGVIYSKTGRDDLALTLYLKVLAIEPRHADAHVNVAALYWKVRRKEEALLHYREARRLRPDDALIEHALRDVGGDTTLVEASPEYTRTLFNAYAPTYDQHLNEALHYRVPAVFQQLLTRYPWHEPHYAAVLDLGCGTGLCAPVLRGQAKHLLGVDLSHEMLAKAREKGGYDELILGEALWYLSQKTAAFDLVVAGDVFVYIGDLDALMARLQEALLPNGRLLFNVEAKSPLAAGYVVQETGRFWHDPAYLKTLAHRYGFMVVTQQSAVLRREAGAWVMGLVCLWEKIVR